MTSSNLRHQRTGPRSYPVKAKRRVVLAFRSNDPTEGAVGKEEGVTFGIAIVHPGRTLREIES